MRPLLTFLAFCVSSGALAAPGPSSQDAKITLALDFCANAIPQAVTDLAEVAARIPGLTLAEPRPLQDIVPEAGLRESLRRVFRIDDDGELGFASFDAQPSPHRLPYAAFSPQADVCLVVGAERKPDDPGLRSLLDAADSGWTPDAAQGDSRLWKRPAPWGENVMIGLSPDEMMVLVALAQRPLSTPAQIREVSTAVLRPCVDAILGGEVPPTTVFEPTFGLIETGVGETSPEVKRHGLRSKVAGPRSVLAYNTYRNFVFCELATRDGMQPAEDVIAAVSEAIQALPGTREQKVKVAKRAAGAAPEVTPLRSWRVSRSGASRKAQIRVGVRDQDIVVVTIEHASGWRW